MNSLAFDLPAPDWPQAKWGPALIRVPALLLLLGAGLWTGQEAIGVIAAGAGLSTGLVGERKIAGSSGLAMVVAVLVIALSAWVGTLSGASAWLNLTVTML